MTPAPGAVVLVGGHESAAGADLPPLAGAHVAAPGRALERALETAAAAHRDRPVVIVPMTLGRDPTLVSDAARTVRWAARTHDAGRFAMAPPFGTADHLVGWLRAVCRRVPAEHAVLIAAPSADVFDDAELHRIAALVRAHGRHRLVEVGLRSRAGGLDDGVERCRALGAERVTVVSAAFGAPADVDERLLSAAATATVVQARVATACHRLSAHGDDGIAAALAADHHTGFAHSHPHDHGHAAAA
jgi:hypothetical protein